MMLTETMITEGQEILQQAGFAPEILFELQIPGASIEGDVLEQLVAEGVISAEDLIEIRRTTDIQLGR